GQPLHVPTILNKDPLWEFVGLTLPEPPNCLALTLDNPIIPIKGRPYTTKRCVSPAPITLCEVPLIFNYNKLILNPGDQVQLVCGIKGNYSHCVWEKDTNIIK
ncbi:unnamed protein product, partial [Meganyctiphanes norvegica]